MHGCTNGFSSSSNFLAIFCKSSNLLIKIPQKTAENPPNFKIFFIFRVFGSKYLIKCRFSASGLKSPHRFFPCLFPILPRFCTIGRGGEDTRPKKAGKINDHNMIPAIVGYK